jgi:hypothetical protein
LVDRVTELPAAAQHSFPKPDIQIIANCYDSKRAFAAKVSDVSRTGKAIKRPDIAAFPA